MQRWPLRIAWLTVWLAAVVLTVGGAARRTLSAATTATTSAADGHAPRLAGARCDAADAAARERHALRSEADPPGSQACESRGDRIEPDELRAVGVAPSPARGAHVWQSLGARPRHRVWHPARTRHARPEQARAPPPVGRLQFNALLADG